MQGTKKAACIFCSESGKSFSDGEEYTLGGDGLKIEFDNDWVHLRTSNTEPIIRIYAESDFETTANNIAMQLMRDIKEFG